MEKFDFRLRFHFLDGDHIEHESEDLLVLEDKNGFRLRLISGEYGKPIKQQSRVALIGGPYPCEDEARQAASFAKRALLIWAVTHRIGIDLGDGKPRSCLTTDGRKLIEAQINGPVRNDVHGVDVYPRQNGLTFFSVDFRAAIGKDPKAFVDMVSSYFREPLPLTEKQIVASEIYCSSFFDVSFRSRLVTLVSAVEALLNPRARSPVAIALVESLEEIVQNSALDDTTKASITSGLRRLRQESIGQTGRSLCERLLSDKEYLGKTAPRFFNFSYDLRSQIVHDGLPHDSQIDLRTIASACQTFVADLILASFELPNE